MESARDMVNELYEFRDRYFERHALDEANLKQERVKEKLNTTMTFLDSLQDETSNKAELCMLKGKALNILPSYDAKAEEFLSRAVKLDPKMSEAWLQLGETYWKKKDVEGSKNCFLGALSHSKDKRALRNLSMVLRQLGASSEEKVKNIEDSVAKAKQAVQLDVKDGMSWFVLGNAYVSLFFASSQNPRIFKQCLSAYQQAEKDAIAANHADLHYNWATARKYQEEFEGALQGFRRARILDPIWSDPQQQEVQLLSFLTRFQELITSKGKLKGKKIQALTSSIKDSDLGPYCGGSFQNASGDVLTLEHVALSRLQPGENANKVILGKVVCTVLNEDPVPFTFCVVDREGTCVGVTLYNSATSGGFRVGDSIAIPEPQVTDVHFTYDNHVFQFRKLRVESPVMLVLNGKKLGVEKQAPTSLSLSVVSD